jgi:adhesin/invasin
MVGAVAETIYIEIEAGTPARITMRAEPDTIYANGFSTSNIYADVRDVRGNPVGRGVRVNFTTTLGEVTSLSLTDSNGVAHAVLRSGTITGIAEVSANSGSANSALPVVFIGSPAASVNLIPSNYTVSLGGSVNLRASVLDSAGLSISNGTRVFFRSVISEVSPSVSQTIDGSANSSLITTSVVGVDTVTATVGLAVDTVLITVLPGAPSRIIVTATPDTIYANGIATSAIRATVFDEFGNTVTAGIAINFVTTRGTIEAIGFTDSNGVAEAELTAGSSLGSAHIQASYGSIIGVTRVVFIGSDAGRIILTADRMTFMVTETNNLRASVFDTSGVIIADGSRVFFSSAKAIANPPVSVTTDGIATSVLQPLGVTGRDTVIASIGSVSDTLVVRIRPGVPNDMIITSSRIQFPQMVFHHQGLLFK